MYYKYPRTLHLPWSEGATKDDKVLGDTHHFDNKRVIVTLKMDGENTTMYSDHIHARSIDSKDHPSRHWVKSYHAAIRSRIPRNYRICGENLFAKHSIFYDNLPFYFMVFSVWSPDNHCLSYFKTIEFCVYLYLSLVPTIWSGIWRGDMQTILTEAFKFYADKHEGYVVRLAESFAYKNFGTSVAKYVRKDHVQTDEHWMHSKIIKNKLR